MAQYLKEATRIAIIESGMEVFSRKGYQKARMGDIAELAGISSGNLYRYFSSKDDLFYTVVDKQFSAKFLKLLRKRVRTLSDFLSGNVSKELSDKAASELLDFWIENRLKVVIVLSEAQGSNYESFRKVAAHELSRLANKYLLTNGGEFSKTLGTSKYEFLLGTIFENTLTTIVKILFEFDDEEKIRRNMATFWRYQIAGLLELSNKEN